MNDTEYELLKIRVRGIKPNEISNTYLQSMCDWFITDIFIGDETSQRKLVFIKTEYIKFFYKRYYPRIQKSTKFIIITGMGDKTIPNQIDRRWRSDNDTKHIILQLLENQNLLGWFAENCDELFPKMYGIPTGVYETNELKTYFNNQFNNVCVFDRNNLNVLCCHRERDWTHERNIVSLLAQTEWKLFTDYFTNIPTSKFCHTMSRYTFTLCVNGGGLDPSPKAFESIVADSIPIIKYSDGIYSAYKNLPVVFIKDWNSDEINQNNLQLWLDKYSKFYENIDLRRETLYKLTFIYWKNYILKYYDDTTKL